MTDELRMFSPAETTVTEPRFASAPDGGWPALDWPCTDHAGEVARQREAELMAMQARGGSHTRMLSELAHLTVTLARIEGEMPQMVGRDEADGRRLNAPRRSVIRARRAAAAALTRVARVYTR